MTSWSRELALELARQGFRPEDVAAWLHEPREELGGESAYRVLMTEGSAIDRWAVCIALARSGRR